MSDHVFFCVEDLLPPNMTLCATYASTITTMIGKAALLKKRFTDPARRVEWRAERPPNVVAS